MIIDNSRILVVEDDKVFVHHLKIILKMMGHTIIDVCSDGEDAVVKARELKPDLILMDVRLQGAMNGVEAMGKIHEGTDIPVVYLTGCEDDTTLQSMKGSVPFGYLLKPFRDSELKIAIEIALYRHRMEKELRERELLYHNLVQNLQGIVSRTFLETETTALYFNEMLEPITGYKNNELPGGRLGSLVLSEDKQSVNDALAEAVAENKPYKIEYRIRHRNGSIRNLLERGRVVKAIDVEKSFIDSFVVDITERMKSEEQLHEVYQKLMERHRFIESILSNIQSGIIVTDLDFCILLLNPSAENFLDVSAKDVIGKGLEIVCPCIAAAVKNGEYAGETCSIHDRVIGYKMFSMKAEDGSVNGYIISFTSLTEIVKIRNEMQMKERLATLGEFVARVAHEIRNPLFGMTAICQIFSMELELNDEHKKLMDTMMKEALRLKQNVEELLDCSRELKIVKKRCDLAKIINESLFSNSMFIDEKRITIEKNIPDIDFSLDADQDKIKQVVINLLRNAVEASFADSTITIYMEKEPGNVLFRVRDSGTGIPENILDKIFEVFYTTKRHGTGLGLAISKNIALAHGGSLHARNNSEGGATFVLSLPVS